jgi:hypothetical protein
MTKIQQIRKEYGETFCNVVKGYAEMGYSRALTAQILGIDRGYFRKLLNRHNLQSHFKPRMEMMPCCRGVGHPGHTERNRNTAKRRVDDHVLLSWVEKCRTVREFNAKSPHHFSTVRERWGSWTEAKRQAREACHGHSRI